MTTELTPRAIVAELQRHIIGQDAAKKAVAVAVRNRWRRSRLDPELAAEVAPKNIIMVGPTGVGKTEIARRLATLTGAPFVKVEATKYTEVGYHGRDVESMIRDLLEVAIKMVRREQGEQVRAAAEDAVTERLVGLLAGESRPSSPSPAAPGTGDVRRVDEHGDVVEPAPVRDPTESDATTARDAHAALRKRLRERLEAGSLEDREIELTVREKSSSGMLVGMMGGEQMDPQMASMLDGLMPQKESTRRMTVAQARSVLLEEETARLLDEDRVTEQAIERTEQTGIVFLDEIDKIATGGEGRSTADVSRQGVQRDLLPIVEGSTVSTRHGLVRTDSILFVAAGAFHSSAVSDLMPELQGRFPIRVELEALTVADFRRILTEPDASLLRQQSALLDTEGLEVVFEDGAIDALAELAAEANQRQENIGARRLMTVVERVLEEVSFDAPEMVDRGETLLTVTAEFVRERLSAVMAEEDLAKFVL